ncbi:MAG: ParB/RepB/Spo0J family partition protein [Chloroflexales bacterium]|nr:ParB/RepB/Spo0J family partition protein [Chloroflexales bacterium]
MGSKRRGGLGSGLSALIPTSTSQDTGVREVSVGAIRPNRSQPRQVFNEQALDELAASIREHGVIQPLIVTAHDDGSFELIAGERRWRAAQRAGLEQVPVLVRETTPQRLLELALVENIQRADLNPLEEGRAYQALKDEFALSDDQIAQRVGKGRVAVANTRRLLNLAPAVQQALLDGAITAGHGRALLMIAQHERQEALLALVRSGGLSVRATEGIAALANDPRLEARMQDALLQGTLSVDQAHALQRITAGPTQAETLDAVLLNGLGVRETERLCDLVAAGTAPAAALGQLRPSLSGGSTPAARNGAQQLARADARSGVLSSSDDANDAEIVRLFEQAVGTPVQVARNGKSIRVTFELFGDEQLRALYDLIVREQDR